jgi:hypothetical protein
VNPILSPNLVGAIGLAIAVVATPADAGDTLTARHEAILADWLARHPQYRAASAADCDCVEDIQRMRVGFGGVWVGVPDYHPYRATGDFNSDGAIDFAVVVIDRSVTDKNYALIVFNGPFNKSTSSPAFLEVRFEMKHTGLFYGPPRPKPYRLVMGPFESHGAVLAPQGRTYKWD